MVLSSNTEPIGLMGSIDEIGREGEYSRLALGGFVEKAPALRRSPCVFCLLG